MTTLLTVLAIASMIAYYESRTPERYWWAYPVISLVIVLVQATLIQIS